MENLNSLSGPLPDCFRQLDARIEQFQKVDKKEFRQSQEVDQKVSDASKGVFSTPNIEALKENVAAVRKEAVRNVDNIDSVMEKLTASIEKLAENSFNPSLTTEQKEAFKNSYQSLMSAKITLARRHHRMDHLHMKPMKPGFAHNLLAELKESSSGAQFYPHFVQDFHRMNLVHNGEVMVGKSIDDFIQRLKDDGLTDNEIGNLSYIANQGLMGDTVIEIHKTGMTVGGEASSKDAASRKEGKNNVKMEIDTQDGARSINFQGDFGLTDFESGQLLPKRVHLAFEVVDFTLDDPNQVDTFRSIVFYEK